MSKHPSHTGFWLYVYSTNTRDYAVATVSGVEILEHFGDGTVLAHITDEVVSYGTARKNPEDKNNKEIGSRLAIGRALSSIGKRLTRQGWGLVKHAEDISHMKHKPYDDFINSFSSVSSIPPKTHDAASFPRGHERQVSGLSTHSTASSPHPSHAR